MADHLGSYNTSSTRTTVRFAFTTNDGSGGAVAPLSAFEAADLSIYKDGSATQRTSSSGVTMTSPFDSIVGLHHVSIDLTDNTDAGFYAAGSWYMVVLNPDETVDGQTVNKVLAYFEIGPPPVNVTQWNGTAIPAVHTAGYPIVTVKDGTGTGEINTDAGKIVEVSTLTGHTAQTGDTFARLGAPAGASVSADILVLDNLVDDLESRIGTPTNLGSGATVSANLIDIESQTDDIGVAGAGLTAADDAIITAIAALNNLSQAQAQSAAESALQTYNLDHLVKSAVDTDFLTTVHVDSVIGQMVQTADGGFSRATDSQEAIRDNMGTAQTGDAYAIVSSGTHGNAALKTLIDTVDDLLDTEVGAIKAKTDNLPSDPADASDIASSFSTVNSTLATIAAYIDTEVAAIKAKTDNLPAAPAATGDIPTVAQIWTTALTEAYASDGSAFTAAQGLFMIWSALSEFAISGTTITCKKLDGSTTSMTFTLDSSSAPTSRTRAG